jgi:RNA polymerase sigma-70 factor (ECF subfamily)
MGEPSDEDLVARWKSGDEAAAGVLLERYLPRLRARASRRLKGALRRRVGESDAIQEAYLTAFLRLEDFEDRGPGSFGHWVAKILDHKLRDEVRRHLGSSKRDARAEVTHGGAGADERPAPAGPSPSSAAGRREDSEAARRAMPLLPARQRDVLRLVHEQGLTLAQVAESLGCSTEAASKVYARAVGGLAELLRPPPGAER